MSWTITIPREVPSQNETEKGRCRFARWRKTKERRNTWRVLCASEMNRAGIIRATGKRHLHILAFRRQRCADIANLIGGAKSCIDGLVDAGLMVDDRDARARITYDQSTLRFSPITKTPCTVITVSDEPLA